jgi:hypothetical protein
MNELIQGTDFMKNGATVIIPGNHTFDYSGEEEYVHYKLMKNLKQINAQNFIDSITVGDKNLMQPNLHKFKEFPIVYLDIDTNFMLCSNNLADVETFKKCDNYKYNLSTYSHFADPNKALNDIKAYQEKIKELLLKLNTPEYNDYKWRIVRMHHPIFNTEQDLDLKLNKDFMQAFKNAGIKIFQVSHNHSAQFGVTFYPDSEIPGGKYNYSASNVRHGNGQRENEPAVAIKDRTIPLDTKEYKGDEDPFYGTGDKRFILRDNIASEKKNSVHVDKSDLLKDTTNHVIKMKSGVTSIIPQVLLGNGGRMNDGLFSDRFSDHVMMYGRSGYNAHGYAYAKFTENKCEITFISSKKENNSKDGYDFKVTLELDDSADEMSNFTELFFTSLKSKYVKK